MAEFFMPPLSVARKIYETDKSVMGLMKYGSIT